MMVTVDLRRRKRMRMSKSEPILGASLKSKCPKSKRILCESYVCDNFSIKNKIPTFNKTGRVDLIQKTAPSNESESIDSFESSKGIEDSVCSFRTVESPNPAFSVSKCINFLKTMGLDEDFYVKAVSWLIKSVDNREGFLGLEVEFREALLRKNI